MDVVPDTERSDWHEKAMVIAEHGELSEVVGFLVEMCEVGRLAARIDGARDDELEVMSHHATEPAAELLAEPHPALAARVFRALGLGIIDAKQSKYYAVALVHFERARDCYRAAGLLAEWDALVCQLRSEHGRKHSFMPGFERIAAGG